jgi:hypothetical protein
MPLAACKVTDNIVPHEWDGKVFSFTHVPDNCPKSDGVIKATKPTFKKEWVIKTLDEIQSP